MVIDCFTIPFLDAEQEGGGEDCEEYNKDCDQDQPLGSQ